MVFCLFYIYIYKMVKASLILAILDDKSPEYKVVWPREIALETLSFDLPTSRKILAILVLDTSQLISLAGSIKNSSSLYPTIATLIDTMHWAILLERHLILKAVSDKLYSINEPSTFSNYNRNAIHIAAIHGNARAISILLEHPRAEINSVDSEGNTALILATIHNNMAVVDLLLNYRTIIVLISNIKGFTALDYAVKYRKMDIMNRLLLHSHYRLMDDVNKEKIYRKLKTKLSVEESENLKLRLYYQPLIRDDSTELALLGYNRPRKMHILAHFLIITIIYIITLYHILEVFDKN